MIARQHWPKLGAGVLVLFALFLILLGDPSLSDDLESQEEALNEALASREYHVDPWELYLRMHDNRVKNILIDVRGDSDYNLFHLKHAKRIELEALSAGYPEKFTTVFVMSNDEAAAEEAWKRLRVQGQKNVYILAGGVNLWLDIFRLEGDGYAEHPHFHVHAERAIGAAADDRLRHKFEAARGDDYPFAEPPELHGHGPERDYVKKVKQAGPAAKKSGGCG